MKDTYLSDEELSQLMEQVEAEQLVDAPEYLEENIMSRIEEKERNGIIIPYRRDVKEPQLKTKEKPPRNKRKELIFYGFKVMLSAAVSIAILLMIPATGNSENRINNSVVGIEENSEKQNQTSEGHVSHALGNINQITSEFCSFLNQSTTNMITKYGGKE